MKDPDLIDISQTLRPDMPVWPGDTAFGRDTSWAMGPDCPVNVSRLTLSTHSGTHADAPLHYDADGLDSAASPLAPYLGPAFVLDLSARGHDGPITPDALAPHLPERVSRVLLRLFPAFPHDHWPQTFSPIAADSIALIAERGGRLIGVDSPSLDPLTSKTMDAHMAVKRAGMAILEGLVLDDVHSGFYELIALPLRMAGADASPVRAVLRRM
ncbi:arylformamidase [Yunchengibacter salinarum]|uniref:arylformamidase n=1 Tax=Yunchengibacter salinarum TaxID=3133399 RepID=UPI0035B616D8